MWQWFNIFFSRLRHGQDTSKRKILISDEQILFERSNLEEPIAIRWDCIDQIETFKVDLVTFDEIRLALRSSETWIELSESDEGFPSLMEAMRIRFPSIQEDWYLEVMQPAFSTNRKTLWKRA